MQSEQITFGVFIVATLGVVLSRFYLNVQNEHWDEKRIAVEKAYEGSMMTKAQRWIFSMAMSHFRSFMVKIS